MPAPRYTPDDGKVRSILSMLDSGMLELACRAVRQTHRLPEYLAVAVMLEAQRMSPLPDGDEDPEKPLETTITGVLSQRAKANPNGDTGQTLQELAECASVKLREILNDATITRGEFERIRRLYKATRDAGITPEPEKGEALDVAHVVALLDQLESNALSRATLIDLLYDEGGQPKSQTETLFSSVPAFVKQAVESSIDISEFRLRSIEKRSRSRRRVAGVCFAVLALGVTYTRYEQMNDNKRELDAAVKRIEETNEKRDDRITDYKDGLDAAVKRIDGNEKTLLMTVTNGDLNKTLDILKADLRQTRWNLLDAAFSSTPTTIPGDVPFARVDGLTCSIQDSNPGYARITGHLGWVEFSSIGDSTVAHIVIKMRKRQHGTAGWTENKTLGTHQVFKHSWPSPRLVRVIELDDGQDYEFWVEAKVVSANLLLRNEMPDGINRMLTVEGVADR